MTERPTDEDDIIIPRKRFWELLPRRSLFRVVTLLVLLAAIVALQRRSGSIVRTLTDAVNGPSPPKVRPAPEGRP